MSASRYGTFAYDFNPNADAASNEELESTYRNTNTGPDKSPSLSLTNQVAQLRPPKPQQYHSPIPDSTAHEYQNDYTHNNVVDTMPRVGFLPTTVPQFNQTSFTKMPTRTNKGSQLARSSSVGTKPILKSSSS